MTQFLQTEAEVREALEKRLRRRIPEDDWALLVDEGRVGDVLRDPSEEGAEEAFEALAGFLRRWGARAPRRSRRPAEPVALAVDERTRALNELAAREAAASAPVVQFRERWLPGGGLVAEAGPWLEAHRKGQRPRRHGWDVLTYDPGGEGVRTATAVPVGREGALRELYTAVEALRQRYGWGVPACVELVLCGRTPAPVVGTLRVQRREHPIGDRVRLEVHPSLSQARVAAFYERARRHGPGPLGESLHPRREGPQRALSRPHARLAVAIAELNDGRSWEEARRAWNGRHGAWAYPDVRWFRRDARAAYRNVTGEALTWRSRSRGGRPPKRRARARRT